MNATKLCNTCGSDKARSEFHNDRKSSDGLKGCCKSCKAEKARAYRTAYPDKNYASYLRWLEKNPEKRAERLEKHREWSSKSSKKSRRENPDAARARDRKGYLKRASDPINRIEFSFRTRFRRAMLGGGSGGAWGLLGYARAELRSHLERQFSRGMSWENFGEWHVDHIVPLASFKTSDRGELISRAWALPNLRPLWATDNWSKGAKVVSLL